MYVIENEGNQQVAILHNLSVVKRPDGGVTNNAKVDEQLYDEGGTVYFIREVEEVSEGTGSQIANTPHPEYKDGKWKRITKYKEPTVPAEVIYQGTDKDAKNSDGVPTYDEFYADNYKAYRQNAYPSVDELMVALWEKEVEGRATDADALEVKRQAVKTKYPAPE